MKCPDCGTEMKPLALSVYCPNDCDRKVQQEIDPEKTPKMIKYQANFKPVDPDDIIYFGPGFSTGSSGIGPDQFDDSWWDGLGWDTD